MYNINALRGTIFCSPIKYRRDLVTGINTVVPDYLPVLIRDAGMLPIWQTWQLSSPDEKEIILFNGDKIDVMRTVNSEEDDAGIVAFAEHCKEIFGRILDLTGYLCYRLALAPSVVISEGGVRPDALYEKLFAIKEFKNERSGISNVSQVFRITTKIGGKDIRVNHLANFHVENDVVNVNGKNQLRERYLCDFDINTVVDPDYRFSINEMKDFFSITPACFKDYYELYK